MGKVDKADALEISHVSVIDNIVTIAWLAPRTEEFYESAKSMQPMDEIEETDICFKLNMEHGFTKGEVFTLVDRAMEGQWTCLIVEPEDNDFRFIARIVPIPPLANYGADEEAPARPPLRVVAGKDMK